MKSNVTVEELNAATLLLTGMPVSSLVQVVISGSSVTAISADEEGNLTAHRVPIGTPPPPAPEPEEPDADDVVEAEVLEESDEDDGT